MHLTPIKKVLIVRFPLDNKCGPCPSAKSVNLKWTQRTSSLLPSTCTGSTQQGAMGSSSSYELLTFHSIMIHKIGYMQISHVSEDDIVFIYPPSVGGSVRKGLSSHALTSL